LAYKHLLNVLAQVVLEGLEKSCKKFSFWKCVHKSIPGQHEVHEFRRLAHEKLCDTNKRWHKTDHLLFKNV